MTTIAYRDGVIAADTLVTRGGTRVGHKTKIFKIGSVLGGAVGTSALCVKFEEWVRGGCRFSCPPMGATFGSEEYSAQGVIITGNYVLAFTPYGIERVGSPYHAFGSGEDIARGALWAGASPADAVRAAMHFDCYTGGDVMVLSA